jgi:hypothetical protein
MNIQTSEVRLRERGHNLGIPMLHCYLVNGSGPPTKDIVTTIVYSVLGGDQKSTWVCLETSEDGIPTGIGSVISGLISCGVDIDLHIHNPNISGNGSSSPSWITKPKTVVVDYSESGNLNYHTLSKEDIILFESPTEDLSNTFQFLDLMPSTKWIHTDNEDYYGLVKGHQRSRISWVS